MVTVKNNKKRLFHFESFGQYKMRVDIGIFKHLSEMTHPNIYTVWRICSGINSMVEYCTGNFLYCQANTELCNDFHLISLKLKEMCPTKLLTYFISSVNWSWLCNLINIFKKKFWKLVKFCKDIPILWNFAVCKKLRCYCIL